MEEGPTLRLAEPSNPKEGEGFRAGKPGEPVWPKSSLPGKPQELLRAPWPGPAPHKQELRIQEGGGRREDLGLDPGRGVL